MTDMTESDADTWRRLCEAPLITGSDLHAKAAQAIQRLSSELATAKGELAIQFGRCAAFQLAAEVVPELLAENESLRAELARLRGCADGAQDGPIVTPDPEGGTAQWIQSLERNNTEWSVRYANGQTLLDSMSKEKLEALRQIIALTDLVRRVGKLAHPNQYISEESIERKLDDILGPQQRGDGETSRVPAQTQIESLRSELAQAREERDRAREHAKSYRAQTMTPAVEALVEAALVYRDKPGHRYCDEAESFFAAVDAVADEREARGHNPEGTAFPSAVPVIQNNSSGNVKFISTPHPLSAEGRAACGQGDKNIT